MKHAVIIPAYNEEKNIEQLVRRVIKLGYMPIVIDDCSKDKTGEIARKSGALTIKHKTNKGKGEAIKTAFRYILEKVPDIEYVAILDADLQYIPEDLPKIFKPLENDEADYVTGYRNWKVDVPFRHRLGNFVWRTAFNILFGANVKDSNCGFIAMTRESVKEFVNIATGGYIIENLFMISAIMKGLRIKQVPVKVYYYEVRDVKTGVRFVSGNLIYIIEVGLKYRYNIDLKLYRILKKLKIIFTKGSD